jgi:hypothetical protein
MKVIPLDEPIKPLNANIIFDTTIDPLVRLKTISEDEFENITCEWAYSFLSKKEDYVDVVQLGGSRDSGRDLVAYLDDTKEKFDIFQCKRYQNPLTPSTYMTEFGKLCYYTFVGEYKVPRKYFIVASNGIGRSLRTLIENPKNINKELINLWDTCCAKKKKITEEGVPLTKGLKAHIEQFDFSITCEISPVKLIDEFSKTIWFKYHFGGGLKKRPKVENPPEEITNDEKTMRYIKQLLKVYSGHISKNFNSTEELKSEKKLYSHFKRQRICFFSAQALKRFTRDELIDEGVYTDVKEDILNGVIDTCEKIYSDNFERVNETLDKAQSLQLMKREIDEIGVKDKRGICHELVNEEELSWVNE